MEQMMREIVQEVYYDLLEAVGACGEELDAETLADTIGDRMYDQSEEYRAMPWEDRRAITLRVARDYA